MTRSRRLGVLLNAEYPAAELVRLGQLVEALGYDQLWYTDVRLFRECFVGLAALAMSTKRIELGPGVTDPYSRHPGATAATMATLDELAGGRTLLGLGVGGTGFRELGITARLPVAALRETVDVVRRLLAGERVTLQGKVIALQDGRLQFAPLRKAIPIYFATHGAQVMRLAGEVADGVLLANTLVPAAVGFYLGQLREGAARAGRTLAALDVALRPEVCIDRDEAAARAVMRRRVAARLIAGYPHWEFLEHLDVRMPEAFTAIAAAKDTSRLDEAAARLPDAVLDRTVLAGPAEAVAERLAAALGPEITSITIRAHAVPGRSVADVLRAFVEQVVPRLPPAGG
ncbi:MAG TPA: LLM class flavin-dependent oxidoreductase [Methylomirabilota bacterium]|jgi:5,10-methylenetetrahydromethanopterin reductase|nr:LLM class flavin-dependent oxidoreductase [Methylomirabilota bacterium]